jgi:predicted DCC family thiol-disulfide oxidoreductase YuxK
MVATDAQTPRQPQWVAIYDGDCGVCTRSVRLLARWDRGRVLELVSSQDPGVPARFPWISPAAYARALQLVGPGDVTYEGADAIEKILDLLPRGALLGWIFRVPLLGRLLDRFYRWFARNRHRLGCGSHCAYRAGKRGAAGGVAGGDSDRDSRQSARAARRAPDRHAPAAGRTGVSAGRRRPPRCARRRRAPR